MRVHQYFYLFFGSSLFGSVFLWPEHPIQGVLVIGCALAAHACALRWLWKIFGDEDHKSNSWVTWIVYAVGSFAYFAWLLFQFFLRHITILLN